MILVVDSTTLTLLINPASNPPTDPGTGAPVTHAADRVRGLIAGMRSSDTLVIPTPVIAEVLVEAGEGGPDVLSEISSTARVRIEGFDVRAAVETAAMTREALQLGDKRSGSSRPYQQIKIDRQIIAIARVHRADQLYTDDTDMIGFAQRLGMEVISTWDLPIPSVQTSLFDVPGLASDSAPSSPTERQVETTATRRVINLEE